MGSCADLCCRASCLCHGHVAGFSSARKDAPAAAPCLRACLGRPSMTCAQYAARSAVRAPPRPATRCAPTVCCPRAVTLAAPRAAPAHLPVTVLSPVRRCPGAGRGGRAAHGARRALLRAARDPEEPGAHPVPVGHPVRRAVGRRCRSRYPPGSFLDHIMVLEHRTELSPVTRHVPLSSSEQLHALPRRNHWSRAIT